MSTTLRVIGLEEMKAALTFRATIGAVREAFVRHARGEVVSPPPGQLLFDAPPGDCHIKFGHFRGADSFVVKVATGFYDNPSLGLPVNDGLVIVLNARTGQPQVLLHDQGWLTSWRTAAAGALAAEVGAPKDVSALGIIGTGHQARLQAAWAARHLGIERVRIFGRSLPRAGEVAEELRLAGLEVTVSSSVEALLDECRLVITCTHATSFIVPADAVRPGTHIVAMGADTPGKQELDPRIFARAAAVMCDDRHQCVDHGELSYAVRSGLLERSGTILLGDVLAGNRKGRMNAADITVTDLTGIPAQDIAIASLVLAAIE